MREWRSHVGGGCLIPPVPRVLRTSKTGLQTQAYYKTYITLFHTNLWDWCKIKKLHINYVWKSSFIDFTRHKSNRQKYKLLKQWKKKRRITVKLNHSFVCIQPLMYRLNYKLIYIIAITSNLFTYLRVKIFGMMKKTLNV